MGLAPLTRIVTNLERHLLSLSNRDFAARPHAALAERAENAVGIQTGVGGKQHRDIVNPPRKIPQRGNGSDVV